MSALTEPGLGAVANPSVPHLDVDPFSMDSSMIPIRTMRAA